MALHDIEPATFERCALIRDWLDDHGVDRVTLLVIPARDLHPLGERSPEMIRWLNERTARATRSPSTASSTSSCAAAPFRARAAPAPRAGGARRSSSGSTETRRAARSTRAGGCSSSPGSSRTASSRPPTPTPLRCARCCRGGSAGGPGLLRLHRPPRRPTTDDRDDRPARRPRSRRHGRRTSRAAQRLLSPSLIRAGLLLRSTRCAWICIRPTSQHPRHMMALEWVLGRSGRDREAITYEQLIDVSRER